MPRRFALGSALTANNVRRELGRLTRAGDVVLTSSPGAVAAGIRLLTRSAVSHAAIVTSENEIVEANDHARNMLETGGGPYVTSFDDMLKDGHATLIAVRRPPAVDIERLQSWALSKLRSSTTFATAGLVMMTGLLVLPRRRPQRFVEWRLRTAEAVADGPSTVTCSEFVYRGLLAASVRIDLSDAQFADAMRGLERPEPEPVVILPSIRRPSATVRGFRAAVARLRPGSQRPQVTDIPELAGYLVDSVRDFATTAGRRLDQPPNGDWADLVTPRDLLLTESLDDVTAFVRIDNGWRCVDLAALRREFRRDTPG